MAIEEKSFGKKAWAFRWWYCAESLKMAADVLLTKIIEYNVKMNKLKACGVSDIEIAVDCGSNSRLCGPYMTLAGLAIENLLKAIDVLENREARLEGGRWKGQKHHGLCDMANAVRFVPDARKRSFLEKLTAYVEWAGRYPIPLEYAKLVPKSSGGKGPEELDFDLSKDPALFHEIYAEIGQYLAEIALKRVESGLDYL